MSYRVAMDIGGTFTDFVMVDEGSQVTSTGKTSTTPASPEQGVLEGLTQVVPELPAISFIVHGTTVGLNAFLERKGTRVLLVMTAGLRDAYSIARHDRKELYTLRYRKPERLVPRRDVYEVTERLRWDGSVDTAFDPSSLEPLIAAIKTNDIEAVAVCLVHAYVNPQHELEAREVLQRECPGLSVTLSHEIAREWREYERASTAVLNAYVAPRVEGVGSRPPCTSCSRTAASPPPPRRVSSPCRPSSPARSAERSGARRSPARSTARTSCASTWEGHPSISA